MKVPFLYFSRMIEKLQFLKTLSMKYKNCSQSIWWTNVNIFETSTYISMKNTFLEKNDKLQSWFSLYVYYQSVTVHTSKEG